MNALKTFVISQTRKCLKLNHYALFFETFYLNHMNEEKKGPYMIHIFFTILPCTHLAAKHEKVDTKFFLHLSLMLM